VDAFDYIITSPKQIMRTLNDVLRGKKEPVILLRVLVERFYSSEAAFPHIIRL
jgi:hypothetical protein